MTKTGLQTINHAMLKRWQWDGPMD